MAPMAAAFVVQIHSGYGELHYDLMLECGDALATWQLARSPEGLAAGCDMPAARLDDHRKAYLAYEGPVSRGRGEVRILDRGTYDLLARGDDRWEFDLHGGALRGRFELSRPAGADAPWLLRRLG